LATLHRERIVSLRQDRDRLSALASLHQAEWGKISPFKTVAQHEEKLRFRISGPPPSETYVLLIKDELAGSVSLLQHDDIAGVRPDLSPWLASLLVVPKHRGRGYGRQLVAHCVEHAWQLGFSTLYLYTHTHPEFYIGLGWRVIEHRGVRGGNVTIMEHRYEPGKPKR